MRKTGSGGRCCVTQGASLALSEDRGVAGVEESTRGRWYMSNYGWFALLHSRNQHTIISYFPPIKKLKQQQQQEKSLLWTYYAYISSMEREGGFRGEPTTVHFLWAQKASLRHLAAYKCNSACSRDMTCAFSYLRFQGHILAKSTAFALQCNGRKSQWLFWEREQKGSCFFSNSFLCYLPMSMYLGKKQKNYDFVSLLIYKEERLRKLLVYLLYLKQQFLVGVYFFEIVNLKINKGIPTNYCICSCGGKKIKFHI